MEGEPTEWHILPNTPEPRPMLIRSRTGYYHMGRVGPDGCVSITCSSPERQIFTTDLRGLIASLQSILALAEEHFGEDWGR